MEYHRNVFARQEAEEEERRLSKVVRESTDAEEVARARADLYERVTLRSEARGGGGFTLADFMSGAFSGFLPPGYPLPLNRPPKRHAAGDEDEDDEDTASSITTCCGERKEKRQRIFVPPRVQEGKEEDAASESVASHQVGEEEEEEETGGEALASSSSP